MNLHRISSGLASLTMGVFAIPAHAQLPPVAPVAPVVAPVAPQVIQWPGGYMVMDGSGLILRNSSPTGRSTNVITGTGNGFGNRIIVDGGASGVTILKNVRNGIGNELFLNPDDLLLDLDLWPGLKPIGPKPLPAAPAVIPPADANPAPPVVEPIPALPPPGPAEPNVAVPVAPPSYKGKANPFWTSKAFNDTYDCNLYWCPTTKLWFRYSGESDTYQPVANQPAPPTDVK